MKRIYYSVIGFVFTLGILVSCTESVDLMTSDVNTGGLITCDGNFPYKLNATPQVDVNVNILQGPAVGSVEVYCSFNNKKEEETSNDVLLTTIDVANANASAEVSKSFSVSYSDLTAGLQFDTWSFPTDESELNIGDAWTLEYVSVMEDGRKVANNNKTVISVANFFAGSYVSTVWYDHPTAGLQVDNEEFNKDLLAISADECETTMSSWSDVQLFIKIDQTTNAVTVRSNEDEWDPLHDIAEGTNSYDPETGIIDVWYGYSRDNGTRKFHEVFVPVAK